MPSQLRTGHCSTEAAPALPILLRWLSVTLLAASCAWIVWRAILLYYPASYEIFISRSIVGFLIQTSGPLLAAGLSYSALRHRSPKGFRTRLLLGTVVTCCFIISLDMAAEGLFVAIILLSARLFVTLVSIAVPNPSPDWRHERAQNQLIVASVALPLLGLPLWSVANIPFVAWRVTAAVGSTPYCIQVPASSLRDTPVTRWGQLAGLRMRTPFEGYGSDHMYQFRHHGILVVERNAKNRFYNWSYAAQNFVPITEPVLSLTHVTAACEPRPGFLYTLGLF